MTNTDLKQIGTLIDSKLKDFRTIVREEVQEAKIELRGEMKSMESRLKDHTDSSIKQLTIDVGDFMTEAVFPMIEQKADKSEVEEIKQIPVIAHELKKRKYK